MQRDSSCLRAPGDSLDAQEAGLFALRIMIAVWIEGKKRVLAASLPH